MTGTIYLHTFPNGKGYIGKTVQPLEKRCGKGFSGYKGQPVYNAIEKYSTKNIRTKILYRDIHEVCLGTLEKICIRKYRTHVSQNGYNITWGGAGIDSATAHRLIRQRVKDGTHPFLGSKLQRQRVRDGTHHLLGGKLQRQSNRQRVKDGTHHLLCDKNPSHKRVEDGKHNFLGSEASRKLQRQRVKDGTHNFLDGQASRKGQYSQRINGKAKRRDLYRIYAALLFTQSLYRLYRTRKLTREGFFDKEIPDTSNGNQLTFL